MIATGRLRFFGALLFFLFISPYYRHFYKGIGFINNYYLLLIIIIALLLFTL